MKPRIGIIGSGIVARTLASGFIKHGYEVTLGTREQSKLEEWKSQSGGKGKTGTNEEAAKFGELLVLAVKGTGAEEALALAGKNNLKGKTIIDTTNPIADAPPVNGVLRYFTTMDKSLLEMLQEAFPEANFVKAFNIIGNPFMVDPDFGGVKPTMFICGNNDEARKVVTGILEEFGHEVEDMGKAEAAGTIESLCILWCIPGFIRNEWNHAFKLLKLQKH